MTPRDAGLAPGDRSVKPGAPVEPSMPIDSAGPTDSVRPIDSAERFVSRPWPLARFGYLYATAVGFVWGSIWSTGTIRRVDGLWVFTGMPKWSFGRGGTCVGACYLTDDNIGERVLRHERVHREQWKHYGMALPILYQLSGRNPLKNRFEIEAGLRDGGYLK